MSKYPVNADTSPLTPYGHAANALYEAFAAVRTEHGDRLNQLDVAAAIDALEAYLAVRDDPVGASLEPDAPLDRYRVVEDEASGWATVLDGENRSIAWLHTAVDGSTTPVFGIAMARRICGLLNANPKRLGSLGQFTSPALNEL
jgi:hypothetical protein